MKNKKISIILISLSAIVFIISSVTTFIAFKSGSEYKVDNALYQLYESENSSGLSHSNLSANSESALKRANESKERTVKFFAISILMYVLLIVLLFIIYSKFSNEQNEKIE